MVISIGPYFLSYCVVLRMKASCINRGICIYLLKSKSEQVFPAHGPYGGHGGSPWDDGGHKGVKKIVVVYGSDAIYSIRFEYLGPRGRSEWSEKHGGSGNGGGKTETVINKYINM